jgi:hypothetical protein
MIQGFEDDDAVFHQGACFGITTDWAIKEVCMPYLNGKDFVRYAKVGTITSQHRFCQIEREMRVDFMEHRKDFDPKEFWNLQSLKSQKIKSVKHVGQFYGTLEEQVSALQKQLESSKDALAASHGTVFLFMTGHVIYIRVDELKKTYRLGDSNTGILDFSNSLNPKTELYQCLHDLLKEQYPDNKFLRGCQFIPE